MLCLHHVVRVGEGGDGVIVGGGYGVGGGVWCGVGGVGLGFVVAFIVVGVADFLQVCNRVLSPVYPRRADPGLHDPDAPPPALGRDVVRVSLHRAGVNISPPQAGEG